MTRLDGSASRLLLDIGLDAGTGVIGEEDDPAVDRSGERNWPGLYEDGLEARGDFDGNGILDSLIVAPEDIVDDSFATNSDVADDPSGVFVGTMGTMRGREDAPEELARCDGAALFLIGMEGMELS